MSALLNLCLQALVFINCFDLNFRWDASAKMYRYSKRGAEIETLTDSSSADNVRNIVRGLQSFQMRRSKCPRYRSFDSRESPRTFVHIELAKEPDIKNWHDFKAAVEKAGLRRIGPYSLREIRSSKVAYTILELFT